MELLLTGSTGFVGRNLLLKIVEDQRWDKIILPVRDPEKLRSQLQGERINHDARLAIIKVSHDAWELPFGTQPDLVIHAAGRLFGRKREEYFQTNVAGSVSIAKQLPATASMIVLSSLAAGGPTPEGIAARTIHDPDAPVSYYGASKLAMERELRTLLGERLLILRPPMVLGPRDTATVPLFQMTQGKFWMKPGLQPKHYSWIAVDDLCKAILKVASADWPEGGSFYLTAQEQITDTELLSTAGRVQEKKGFLMPVPLIALDLLSLILDAVPAWRNAVPSLGRDRVREILPDRWVCDGSEFAEKFSWNPESDLEETLRQTAEWLKEQGKI